MVGGGPKLTAQQIHEQRQAEGNVETRHAREVAAERAELEAEHDERLVREILAQREKDVRLSEQFGTPATAEANLGRSEGQKRDDRGYERER
jgi:hypothetical protein